jgi:hypothetical protein
LSIAAPESIIPPTDPTIQCTPPPAVPYVELSSLMRATGDFSESNIIGRGGFGIVYEVRKDSGFLKLIICIFMNRILIALS